MAGPKKRARVAGGGLLLVPLDPAAPLPLHRQIYEGLRAAIVSGRLAAGARIPSSRVLAADLGVARNTVVLAFEQLRAEGYLAGRRGGGTRVRGEVPDALVSVAVSRPAPGAARAPRASPVPRVRSVPAPVLPERWVSVMASVGPWARTGGRAPVPFAIGLPAIDAFPTALWARLTARQWRTNAVPLGYANASGDRALREAVASYLATARAARVTPDQVVIVNGAQQALDLAARVIVDPGDAVWMEDPGYPLARAAFVAAGARVVSVPVDADGLDVNAGIRAAPHARLVYVTPSHQFPLGSVMSSSRRLALLRWARRTGAWILEDDYDSEFRYATRPLACLQGLDAESEGSSRVLYVGTFSKTLAPALRLGYLVVPDPLIDAFQTARLVASGHSPTVDQAVLADFIGDGHYVRHVRRVRALCAERQHTLLAAASVELEGLLAVAPDPAGLHVVGRLRAGITDVAASAAARAAGVDAAPLSYFAVEAAPADALLLGYAAFDDRAIRRGVRRLGEVVRGLSPA
jgi:GntR family transcriptional regulator / MocR family aminotransferase